MKGRGRDRGETEKTRVIREGVRRGEGNDLRSLPPTELFDLHNDFIRNLELYYKLYVCQKLHEARLRALEEEVVPLGRGKGGPLRLKRR